jgi:hypothetical protein
LLALSRQTGLLALVAQTGTARAETPFLVAINLAQLPVAGTVGYSLFLALGNRQLCLLPGIDNAAVGQIFTSIGDATDS